MKKIFSISIIIYHLLSCSSTTLDQTTPEKTLEAFIKAIKSDNLKKYLELGYPEDVKNFEEKYPNKTIRKEKSLSEMKEIKKIISQFENRPFNLSWNCSSTGELTGYFRSDDTKLDLWLWQFKGYWYIKFFDSSPKDPNYYDLKVK